MSLSTNGVMWTIARALRNNTDALVVDEEHVVRYFIKPGASK
jgi:hypothetical protein